MIVILLALLGIPLWLLLGVLGVGLWSRRNFQKTPGVFAVKVRRLVDGARAAQWPRRPAHARWVHDVLIVHQGVALVRNRALPVASVLATSIRSGDVRGLGEDPVGLRLHLDGGEVVEVATRSADRDALVAPFRDRLGLTT